MLVEDRSDQVSVECLILIAVDCCAFFNSNGCAVPVLWGLLPVKGGT